MAGTQFSPDRVKAGPGRNVGAGPGPMQRRSDQAERRAAPRPGKGQAPAGAQPAPRPPGAQLGHPWSGQEAAPEQGQPAGDFRHVQLLAQHQNMRGLGREAPFGVSALLSGEHRQLFSDPDKVPYDVLEDGP